MVIAVSLIDTSKPKGKMHIGTVHLPISVPYNDFIEARIAIAPNKEAEEKAIPILGKVMTREDMLTYWGACVDGNGKMLEANSGSGD